MYAFIRKKTLSLHIQPSILRLSMRETVSFLGAFERIPNYFLAWHEYTRAGILMPKNKSARPIPTQGDTEKG